MVTDPTSSRQPSIPPLDFEVEAEGAALGAFVQAARTFNQLVAEVATGVVGEKGLVRWVVTGVAAGSVDLQLRPEPVNRRVPQHAADEISAIVVNGIYSLAAGPTRPEFFTVRALELARSLSEMVGRNRPVPRVTVRHGELSANLSRHVAVNVSRVLLGDEAPYSEHGTVEGRLEALNVHGTRVFSIWDPLTSRRIVCDFGYRIPSQDVGAAAERRVVVSGVIHYDIDGNIDNVVALEMEVMPEEDKLPAAEEAMGIFADG